MPSSKFPLKVADSRRWLVQADGTPFLYQADTPWMLFFKATLEEVESYAQVRTEQGYTAAQIQLTGFLGLRDQNGELPFGEQHDFSTPNERFFDHVEAVLERLAKAGLYAMVAPFWSGCCREGWAGTLENGDLAPLNRQGPEACRAVGEWIGRRFAHVQNLGWILGGDNDPFNAFEEIQSLARGLRQAAPTHLLTYHASSTHSSLEVFPQVDWLDLSMVYTYFRGFNKAWNRIQPDVHEVCESEARRSPAMPYFLGESTYEGEHEAWGSAHQIRKQAWQSVLSGGCGHAYGSADWRCEEGFLNRLRRPGANSLRTLADVLLRLGWPHFEPDWRAESVRITPNPFGTNDYAVVAQAPGGKLVYLPSPRLVEPLADNSEGIWIDPTNGAELPARWPEATMPGPNAQGDPDWLLHIKEGPNTT